jgi:gas vesicle protein
MGKARNAVLGGVVGAAVGVVLAPRLGESRREALDRLRLAARSGRGSVRAFSGTPCAAEVRAAVRDQGDAPRAAGAASAASAGGEDDG